ncbi:hypothetical protein [Ohtaekwangia sp.]|uniref:hypothetical protein n=1 Tax=Ohtaekwangia sp. TaxID=2066019 RepID=UPI002FDD7C5B
MRICLLALFILIGQWGWAQKPWKTFVSEKGAFSADFPAEPQVTSVNRQTPEGIDIKINIHMVTAESVVAYVIYNEFPVGFNILDDSLYLTEVTREAVARIGQEPSLIQPMTFEGFPGRKLSTKMKDGIMEINVILRTNRAYIVTGFFPEGRRADLTKFMKSFKFLPYKKPEWTNYQSTDNYFKADFPTEPTQEEDNSSGTNMLVYYGQDINSSNNYSLAIEKYSIYDQFESDTAVLDARVNAYKLRGDSVIQERDVMIDGRPAKDVIMTQGKNHFQFRIVTFVRGLFGYTLFTFLPPEDIQGETANHFFHSFRFVGQPPGDLLADKKSLLLKDIVSPDTSVWKKAKKFFSGYEFKESDLETLQSLITKIYSDDREPEHNRKEVMLDALANLKSGRSISFIERIFPLLVANPSQEYAALKVLSKINNRQSLALLAKLLPKHKPVQEDSWKYNVIFSPYVIDSAEQKSFLLSTIKLLPTAEYKNGLYMLVNHLLKNKTLTFGELVAYRKIILQDLESESQTYLKDSTYKYLDDIVAIAGYDQPTPKVIETLLALARQHDTNLTAQVVTTLLRLKQKPDEAVMESLAKNLQTRTNFYVTLNDFGLQQHFPAKYANQDSLAVGEFNDFLSGEYDSYDVSYPIKIVYKTEHDYKGERKKFYVVKFFDEYEGAWYRGVCGGYTPGKLEAWGTITSSDFTTDKGKDHAEYLKKYLEDIEKAEE